MDEKNKNINICIKDPMEIICLAIAIFMAVPLTNALLITDPIIAAIIDFGLMSYLIINIICIFFI